MAAARDVTLRSRVDEAAPKTYEEALPRAETPPLRTPTLEEASESVAEEEAARVESTLIEKFDSSRVQSSGGYATRPTPSARINESAPGASARARGNDAMKRGDFSLAHGLYTEALEMTSDEDVDLRAVIFCNRALSLQKMGEYDAAMCDAKCAEELAPTWSKPKHRLAEACMRLGSYALAVHFARAGEVLQLEEGNHSKSFRDLLDEIAICAAENGSVAGFDGKLIFVRSAGEEAWLGRPAPLVAAFDELDDEIPDPMFGGGAPDAIAQKPVHARSLPEAISKAQDGDRILLLRGIHNGCATVCEIDKRVLIRGEGAFREATADCRNNSPLFRIKRSCVIQNLDVDFTGFCEAIRINGDARVKPFIENCVVKSSGGDGIAVGGKSAPLFRNCVFTGRLSAIRTYKSSTPTFVDCHVTRAEKQGVLAMEDSRVIMHGCVVQSNQEDGVVIMERANMVMSRCIVNDNEGVGIDVSDKGKAVINECEIEANIGGVWLWDESSAHATSCTIQGGKSHAIVLDGKARASCRRCTIVGVVHASEKASRAIMGEGTAVQTPDVPTSFPAEVKGAFKYDPCPYTRKQ